MTKTYRNPEADARYRALTENLAAFPFSFTYDGERLDGFDSETFRLLSRESFSGRNCETTVFRLGLEKDECLTVTLQCSHYPDHGVSEWTVWFENPGGRDSGVIGDPMTRLTFEGAHPMLEGILGDHTNYYRPYTADLSAAPVRFESNSGRATHVYFPYFNLEYGEEGVMLAIGWAGTWRADFRFRGGVTEYTARSVNGMNTCLRPGEKIRTALFVMAPYTVRNRNYAANFWRSWYIESNLPHADASGKPFEPLSTCCLSGDTGLPQSDGSISERWDTWRPSLEKMLAEDARVDVRWFDAGWYLAPDGGSAEPFVSGHDWWDTVGTWELDPAKWPGDAFRQSTDFTRAHGMKTMMWFEPERVTDVENLVKSFGYREEWAIRRPGTGVISNNIGDPDCYAWTLGRITKTLSENHVDIYREDNNSDQAGLWKYLDEREGENRRGITECKFIGAHYRMWDDIIACTLSYGGCGFVDSCASGGGRNDLESMRRGVPFLRSDFDRESTGLRLSMTSAFCRWIPVCGAITREQVGQLSARGVSDPYVWRASYLPILNVASQFVQDPDQDFGVLRFGLREWKKVQPYLLKDFLVLTPWHTKEEVTGFTAFAYFDPETRRGVLLAFRQEGCTEEWLNVTLPFGECVLTDEDTGERIPADSSDGAELFFAQPRTARLLWIEAK